MGLPGKKKDDTEAPSNDGAPEEEVATEQEGMTDSERITNLERCLSKMAHFTGTNRVLDEFNIPRWEVTKESMRKGGK